MHGAGRLPVCVAVVLVVHAALIAASLRPSVSAVPRPSPHRTSDLRLVVLGPMAEPQVTPATPRPPAVDGGGPAREEAPAATPPSPAAQPWPRMAAGQSAQAPERVASAPPSPQASAISPLRDFLSPAQVDRVAIAFPSPDTSRLAGLSWSGQPLRFRVFVSADGRCVDLQVLSASEDAQTLAHLRQMFLATHFIPARRAGTDVASYRDIELDVSDVK